MKSVVRVAVFTMVVAGAITSFVAPRNTPAQVNHQAVSSNMPRPDCPLDDPQACGFR